MIIKMKFLSITGPKSDIDRVSDEYLSKYEIQLENAIAELKTTDNLLPFAEMNPYKEALMKADYLSTMLAGKKAAADTSLSKNEMVDFVVNLHFACMEIRDKIESLYNEK